MQDAPRNSSRIKRVDIESALKRAAKDKLPAAYMETVRITFIKRIQNGEHIHLYGQGFEECIYPTERCWEGLRDLHSVQIQGL